VKTHRPPPRPGAALSRRDRLEVVEQRDGAACVWCRRPFDGLVRATTEHVVPRVKGGPAWLENEVAACARCNRARGHRSPADWLEACEARGWHPDRDAIVASLRRLDAAIAARGGQRRARPYLAAQLRRLAA
jgi:5-methylcytosine-specific restriction endonuclease McrA